MRIINKLSLMFCATLPFFQAAIASQHNNSSLSQTLAHKVGQSHLDTTNAFNDVQPSYDSNGQVNLQANTPNQNLASILPTEQQRKIKEALEKGRIQGLKIAAAQEMLRIAELDQLNHKDQSFEHAMFMGKLSAAATLAGKQYISENKGFGSTITDAAHKGADMAISALVNAAIVGGITYGAESLYNYFFSDKTPKKEIPADLLKTLAQKKQQELINKEKAIINTDIKALKAQSEILAAQCTHANTPALKSLCEAMRTEILKQNFMALAKRAQLDGLSEEADEVIEVVEPQQAEKDNKKSTTNETAKQQNNTPSAKPA